MAKIRHIAVCVADPDASAKFYSETFDLEIVGRSESEQALGVYLSDGTICLALLKYYKDAWAGAAGKDHIGSHHFGFWCDDLDEQGARIEQGGGKLWLASPGDDPSLYFETKYLDPDGVVFDVSENGWVGATK